MIRRAAVLFVLVAAVMASAILVVRTTYHARALQQQLRELRVAREHLSTEWAQLRLEVSAWTIPGRVARVARQRLDMHQPESWVVVEVQP